MKGLTGKQKLFFVSIYILTVSLFCYSVYKGHMTINISDYVSIAFFIVLTAITESFTISFMNMSFSTTFAITLASYILFGPFQAIVIFIIGFLMRVLKLEDNTYNHVFNSPLYGTVFNCCALVLPIIIGNDFYILLGGHIAKGRFTLEIIPLILFSTTWFLGNTLIMSMLMAIYSNESVLRSFKNNIALTILNYIIMVPFGVILASVFALNKYLGVVFIVLPIVLVRYTFSLYIDSKSQFIQTVDAFMNALEARDEYTEGHSDRVADIAINIARGLKYNEREIENLKTAAMLHDIGKIGIRDNILNKPGKLTEEEFATIKKHPEIGFNILKNVKNMEQVFAIVRNHHERYDGKGYPDGKKGDEISLDVYIVQLADAVDAMATDRPYRKGLSQECIMEEITKNSGTQFHPKVVEVYLDMYNSKS